LSRRIPRSGADRSRSSVSLTVPSEHIGGAGDPAGETPGGSQKIRHALPLREKLWGSTLVRRSVLLLFLLAAWQLYAVWLDRPLLVPTFTAAAEAFVRSLLRGELPARAGVSLRLLLAA